jgi:hypothetical protein
VPGQRRALAVTSHASLLCNFFLDDVNDLIAVANDLIDGIRDLIVEVRSPSNERSSPRLRGRHNVRCVRITLSTRNVRTAGKEKARRSAPCFLQLDEPSAARIALGLAGIVLGLADGTLDHAGILLQIAFQLLRTVTRQLAGRFLDRALHFVGHALGALVVHAVFSLVMPQECDRDILSNTPLAGSDHKREIARISRHLRYPLQQIARDERWPRHA